MGVVQEFSRRQDTMKWASEFVTMSKKVSKYLTFQLTGGSNLRYTADEVALLSIGNKGLHTAILSHN